MAGTSKWTVFLLAIFYAFIAFIDVFNISIILGNVVLFIHNILVLRLEPFTKVIMKFEFGLLII